MTKTRQIWRLPVMLIATVMLLSALFASAPMFGLRVSASAQENEQQKIVTTVPDYVVADWVFSQDNAEGLISDGSLTIKDKSGRVSDGGVNNDLELEFYGDINDPVNKPKMYKDATGFLTFEDKKMTDEGTGSIKFSGVNYPSVKANNSNVVKRPDIQDMTGAAFMTKAGAPINDETFMDGNVGTGWTIEILYMLNGDFDPTDNRMGIISRASNQYINASGNPATLPSTNEVNQKGPFAVSVTNCKEPQVNFLPYNNNMNNPSTTNLRAMTASSWGLSMDNGGKWYNLIINCDNDWLRTFLNDGDSFRNRQGRLGSGAAANGNLHGLYTNVTDKRWRIGANWETYTNSSLGGGSRFQLWKLLQGNIERIRISKGAIDKVEWLVPDSSMYMEGMGRNGSFMRSSEETYTMAFIPDTQNTIRWTPDVSMKATEYMLENKADFNLTAIAHLGDVTDANTAAEWTAAKSAFWPLAENFNYLSNRGNHDGTAANYAGHFGPNATFNNSPGGIYNGVRYGDIVEGKVFFSASGDTSYTITKGGSYDYLLISIGDQPAATSAELVFLENTLKAYPTLPTIIVSHNIFGCSAAAPDRVTMAGNATGTRIWNIAKKYDNVFMMVAGHNHGSGYMQGDDRLFNDYGNEVIGMLVDLQFGFNGGNAWYRFVEFNEAANKLDFTTFSPYAASLPEDDKLSMFNVSYYDGIGLNWTLDFNFVERFSFYINEVTFVDWDGTVLKTESVGHGTAVTAPIVSAREGYTFIGWSVDIGRIVLSGTITALYVPNLVGVSVSACVNKLNGNKNDLTVIVTELYYDGSTILHIMTFQIDNNAAGAYSVCGYNVYVNTKGNDQIRECYIV